MSTYEKKLRIWKCCNANCKAEIFIGVLRSSDESDNVVTCPYCCRAGTIMVIESMEYVITESKTSSPDVSRAGSVARRPMAVQESGVSNPDSV